MHNWAAPEVINSTDQAIAFIHFPVGTLYCFECHQTQ